MAYQEMVKNLEEARQLWEREMELLCKVGSKRGGNWKRRSSGEVKGSAVFTLVYKIVRGYWSCLKVDIFSSSSNFRVLRNSV